MGKIMEKWKTNSGLKTILTIVTACLIILLAPITMPLIFLGGAFGIWYFAKKNPNTFKRNLAILIMVVGTLGCYAVGKLNPEFSENQQSHSQAVQSTSSVSSSNSSKANSSSSSLASEEKEKQEKAEQERKQKLEQEKQAQEEQKRKEAEAAQLVNNGEQAVKNLEDNQINENVAPAQAAVDQIADPDKKTELQNRIGLVQNAITQREEQARQEAERPAAAQAAVPQEESASAGGYFRDYRGRWHRSNGQYASKKEIAEAGLIW